MTMTIPKNVEKYRSKAVIRPDHFLKQTNQNLGDLPSRYIITYQSFPWSYFLNNFAHIDRMFPGTDGIAISKNIGFLKISGIGAPMAVTVLEELIALGGKRFVNMGTSGGLNGAAGIVLCNKALRDEGTSLHYFPDSRYAFPSEELTNRLEASLKELGIEYRVAPGWTTDAPYRETVAELEGYRKEGIETVDMETSALFTLGKYRNVDVASAFVISDLLDNESWDPKFHTKETSDNLTRLVDASMHCLLKE